MHVRDCIETIIHLTDKFLRNRKGVDVNNIGSDDRITVKEIAKIVAEEMKTPNIKFKFTGGVDGGRGWKEGVKKMQLSINRLLKTGWKPKYTSRQAVRLTAKTLKGEMPNS